MSDLIDGTLDGWPVSLMIERGWSGAPACGAHCCAYSGENDEPAPDAVVSKCYAITDACQDGPPSKSLRTAKRMGFVPDGCYVTTASG